jgi:hypothetical protein
LGVAPVPESTKALRLSSVVYVPIKGLSESEIAVAFRSDSDEPVVRAFLNF